MIDTSTILDFDNRVEQIKSSIKSVKDFNEFITDLVSKVLTFIFITFLIIIVVSRYFRNRSIV